MKSRASPWRSRKGERTHWIIVALGVLAVLGPALFRPKQVVNDIRRASDPDLPPGHWRDRHVSPPIHWWWATWLISTFVERVLFRRSVEAGDTPAEFVSLSKTFIAWDLVDIIPAILAILVVMKITARQEERRRRFESGELDFSEPEPVTPFLPPEPWPMPMDVAPPAHARRAHGPPHDVTYHPPTAALLSGNGRSRMLTPRQIAALAAVIAALVVTIGINRIVVTDGAITAAAPAFKSDYLPLER